MDIMAAAMPVVDIPSNDPVANMAAFKELYTATTMQINERLKQDNKRLKRDIAAPASLTKVMSIQLIFPANRVK